MAPSRAQKKTMNQGQEINPFRAAKPYLWNGDAMLSGPANICAAIGIAVNQELVSTEDGEIAYAMVTPKLGGYLFASTWLRAWLEKTGQPAPSEQQTQEWRHRWLDHLADEWDKGIRV